MIKQKAMPEMCISLLLLLCIYMPLQARQNAKAGSAHLVMVNQGGYNAIGPKRFTAPVTKDGITFILTQKDEKDILYSGKIEKGIGDFSDFHPAEPAGEYVIHITGGRLKEGESYPFTIAPFWIEKTFRKPALDFMIDDRSVTGTHPSAYGGCPWRDGTYYSFDIPSLVMQFMSNPEAYIQMPVTLDYNQDKQRILSSSFHYVLDRNGGDSYDAVKRYYTQLDPPVGDHVPDIIQLIHWGIGYYLMDPATADPSGDPTGNQIHAQTMEQFAFFLYAYPYYKKYFTDNFYQRAKDFAFAQWGKSGLFDVITMIGTGKGRECPGHSILPNLLMYEVAKRENRKDAARYFDAAYHEVQWVISSLDWKDPRTTKGQRMSEHKLMPGLVYFLQKYPEKSPPGLQQKIEDWATIMIARSDNMWDFRRYDMVKNWSIPEYNEPGNLAGFPACALSAASVLTDMGKRKRLQEIAIASLDNLLGRNPLNAASPNHPEMGFSFLEKGWPKSFSLNTCARLETVRGTLNSSCSTEMYPFNPGGAFRHPEGWTAFNTAWNVGLAYMSWYDTKLQLMDKGFKKELLGNKSGKYLFLQLWAPLNFDNAKVENAFVKIITTQGSEINISLKETRPGSSCFRAVVPVKKLLRGNLTAKAMIPEFASADKKGITISYGNGIFIKQLRLIKEGRFLRNE